MDIWLKIAWIGILAFPTCMYMGATLIPESKESPHFKRNIAMMLVLVFGSMFGGLFSISMIIHHYDWPSFVEAIYSFGVLPGSFIMGTLISASRNRRSIS